MQPNQVTLNEATTTDYRKSTIIMRAFLDHVNIRNPAKKSIYYNNRTKKKQVQTILARWRMYF